MWEWNATRNTEVEPRDGTVLCESGKANGSVQEYCRFRSISEMFTHEHVQHEDQVGMNWSL